VKQDVAYFAKRYGQRHWHAVETDALCGTDGVQQSLCGRRVGGRSGRGARETPDLRVVTCAECARLLATSFT
jgi:hypothetical protein